MNSFSIFFKKTAGYHTIVYEDGDVKNYKIISEPNENGSLRAPNNDQMVDIHTITVTEWCPNQLVIMAAAGGGNLQQKLQPGQMVIMRMSSGEATMRGLWSENGQECPGTKMNFSKGSKMKVASVRGAFFTTEQFSTLWVPVKCVDGVGGVSGGGMFGGGGGGGGFGNPAAGGMFGGQPKPAMGGGMGGGGMGFGNTAAGGSMFGGTGGVINSGNKTLKSENGFGFGFGQRNMYDHDVESVVDTEANSRPAAGGFRFG